MRKTEFGKRKITNRKRKERTILCIRMNNSYITFADENSSFRIRYPSFILFYFNIMHKIKQKYAHKHTHVYNAWIILYIVQYMYYIILCYKCECECMLYDFARMGLWYIQTFVRGLMGMQRENPAPYRIRKDFSYHKKKKQKYVYFYVIFYTNKFYYIYFVLLQFMSS